jgi:DNA invertase Pin-like site-specific DNA recombinase
MPRRMIRAAIYCRKSSEEGLDLSFNSLQAQRESCLNYVRSQAHEGWIALDDEYNDPAFSGGNLQRPALQRLLHDIGAGRVDAVVCYRIDRLTRALTDFAKLVDVFEQKNISLVSITESFNTATSLGRLVAETRYDRSS